MPKSISTELTTKRRLRFIRLERRYMLSGDFGELFDVDDDDFEDDIEEVSFDLDDHDFEFEFDNDSDDRFESSISFQNQSQRVSTPNVVFANESNDDDSDSDEELDDDSNETFEDDETVASDGDTDNLSDEATNSDSQNSTSTVASDSTASGSVDTEATDFFASLVQSREPITELTSVDPLERQDADRSNATFDPNQSDVVDRSDGVERSVNDESSDANAFPQSTSSLADDPATDSTSLRLAIAVRDDQLANDSEEVVAAVVPWIGSIANDIAAFDEAFHDFMNEAKSAADSSLAAIWEPSPGQAALLTLGGLAVAREVSKRRTPKTIELRDLVITNRFDVRLYPEMFG